MGLCKKPLIHCGKCHGASKYCSSKRFKRFLPIAEWLPKYNLLYLKNDLIAGITVGFTLIPQALAFAQVANLPPEYGLYSSFIGLFVYTLLGTSKDAGIGPTNLLSMLVGQVMLGLNSQNPVYTTLMSLFCGFALLLMGLLQLGFLINMFSIPVISGFTSAAGLIIIVNQLSVWFGIPGSGVTPFDQIVNFVLNFTKMNFGDIFMGAVGLVFLIIMQRLPSFTSERSKSFRVGTRAADFLGVVCACRNVILVVFSTIFTFVFLLIRPDNGITLMGKLPSGLPEPSLPEFSILNRSLFFNESDLPVVEVRSFSDIISEDLNMSLLVFPLMAMLELFAITKALGRKNHYKVDYSQELIAVGIANIAGSFFHAMPITAAATRSAVNDQCKVSTPLAGTFSALIVIFAALFGAPVFFFIPKGCLAAVIMSAGIALIDLATVAHVWHEWKWDLMPLIATFLVSIIFQMWQGILVGIAISLALLLAPVVRLKIVAEHLTSESDLITPAKPMTSGSAGLIRRKNSVDSNMLQTPPSFRQTDLARQQQTELLDRIVIVRLQQGLQYPSVDRFTDRMSKILAKDSGQIVIIDCQFITGLDFTALQGIRQVLLLAYRLDRSVVFARLSDHLRKHIELLDMDHFRHVADWEDIFNEEDEDADGSKVSLNGSALKEQSIDAIATKKNGQALEDLTPIPEEHSEKLMDAVVAVRSPKIEVNGHPTNEVSDHAVVSVKPAASPISGKSHLAYEPHFFGSAIPLAVGSVSLEDLGASPAASSTNTNKAAIENFLKGSKRISYKIAGYEEDDDDSASDKSDTDDSEEAGLTITSVKNGFRRKLNKRHASQHVELLEFTGKVTRHGKPASPAPLSGGMPHSLRRQVLDSAAKRSYCSQISSSSQPSLTVEDGQGKEASEEHQEGAKTPNNYAETWHGAALAVQLNNSRGCKQKAPPVPEAVTQVRLSPRTTTVGETSVEVPLQQRSPFPTVVVHTINNDNEGFVKEEGEKDKEIND